MFLDANRNGRYELDEEYLPRITVYLDGRYPTESDADGRFEFWPVRAGQHYVRVAVEDAPLPWGLDDEAPRAVLVPVRGDGRIDFGLVNLNE